MMREINLQIYRIEPDGNILALPFADQGVAAGFPSPAQDYMEDVIDLNRILVRNAPSTFLARVRGDSLCEDDICDGDILVIDKSLSPQQGDLAVCAIDGEFTVKYIDKREDGIWLIPANKNFEPIHVTEDEEFIFWGIVTYSIKQHRRPRK